MESIIDSSFNLTDDKWNLYYHLPQDPDWTKNGYKIIMSNINYLEEVNSLCKHINENIIKSCMLFVMKDNIFPTWEDPCNKNGGCFSYKVPNKQVFNVWNNLFKYLCSNTLSNNTNASKHINGITISPKKNFCIVKIWLDCIEYQDPQIIKNIDFLNSNGCIFKKHEPES
jgi:hypothetical protein